MSNMGWTQLSGSSVGLVWIHSCNFVHLAAQMVLGAFDGSEYKLLFWCPKTMNSFILGAYAPPTTLSPSTLKLIHSFYSTLGGTQLIDSVLPSVSC